MGLFSNREETKIIRTAIKTKVKKFGLMNADVVIRYHTNIRRR
jgi:hypothetical protein